MTRTLAAGALPGGLAAMIGTFVTMPARPTTTGVPNPDDGESSFDLIGRAKRGDAAAMDVLCARYLPRLQRWAHGRLPASSRGLLDSQDLAQEVLFRAVEHVHSFEPQHQSAFQAYVRRILLNRVRDEVRKGKRRPAPAPLEDGQHQAADPSPLELAIGTEAVERYEAALAKLKDEDQSILVARLELGFSAAEIAAEFNKPSAAAAQMAVSRALVRLAKEMVRV